VSFVGLTIAETAIVMNVSQGTVKSTLADASAKLRNQLEVNAMAMYRRRSHRGGGLMARHHDQATEAAPSRGSHRG
jgi:hypothetical protein